MQSVKQEWLAVARAAIEIEAASLARAAGLSISQLQREFARLLQLTPSAYLLRVRVLMARRRLTADEARAALDRSGGALRRALEKK